MSSPSLDGFGCLPPGRFEAQEVPKEAGKVVAGEDEEARFLGQGLGTIILSESHL